jgi:1-phosphofructokinase
VSSVYAGGQVAIFSPHPLLSITLELHDDAADDVHVHVGGQGVWVARMAAEMGAQPLLCGFSGGETGVLAEALLSRLPCSRRLVRTTTPTGCYVTDRRAGGRNVLGRRLSDVPSRHEVDDLVATTCVAALESDVLVVCNPYPGDSLPVEVYGTLVGASHDNGIPVLVDLSSPRLDSALEGRPDLVKLNDWELAEFVRRPVGKPHELRAAAEEVRDRGAGIVVVTRAGEPALVLRGDDAWELVPPRFERGFREGCGDTMMGAIAAGWARGIDWQETLVLGAAAGAVNYLRHGLGTGSRATVEDMCERVALIPLIGRETAARRLSL